jgi:polysaccharide deacetylase 2 family uncharacterized protein YibQ
MRKKKRKGSDKKRKLAPIPILIILPICLACILLFGLSLYFTRSTIGVSQPVYEEVYSSTNSLHEAVRKIDFSIYESLYRSGIAEKNVSFLNIQPRNQNGHFWDFTELLIKCDDSDSAQDLERIIEKDLAALGTEVRLRNEKTPDGRRICHVFAEGFYTHKIDLIFEPQPQRFEDERPRLAVIIDDLGYDLRVARSFIQLDLPLSFSVLPSAPFTKRIVKEANKAECELILHLPMEPKNYPSVNPGPGALYLSMDERGIRQTLDGDLREIEGVKGVNNHMGSSFTENTEKMLIVLKYLKEKELFFVDSLTTSRSVGFKLARKIGLPTAGRSVFLDNELSQKAIRIQIDRLLSIARHSGDVIGIGHPHRETLEALREYCSKMRNEFRVVTVSELVG